MQFTKNSFAAKYPEWSLGESHNLFLCLFLLLLKMNLFVLKSGTISKDNVNKQVLDKLQVERERGITVKAQTASLIFDYEGETYLLNLVDTPVSVNMCT